MQNDNYGLQRADPIPKLTDNTRALLDEHYDLERGRQEAFIVEVLRWIEQCSEQWRQRWHEKSSSTIRPEQLSIDGDSIWITGTSRGCPYRYPPDYLPVLEVVAKLTKEDGLSVSSISDYSPTYISKSSQHVVRLIPALLAQLNRKG